MPSNEEILRKAKEALDKAVETQRQNRQFMASIGPAIVEALRPVLNQLLNNSKIASNDLKDAVSNIRVEVNPEVRIPNIEVPPSEISVDVPKINTGGLERAVERGVRAIKLPSVPPFPKEMDIKGWVRLQGVDLDNPLPVQLRDAKGNPLKLFENLTQIVSQGGGGAAKVVKVSGFGTSSFAEITNPDGRVKVELQGETIRVVQVKDVGVTTYGEAEARTTNPTPATNGDPVRVKADDLGRQVNTPIQVRDLRATAYASVSTGAETTLLAGGGAGVFHDLIYVMGANQSDAAVIMDIRDVTAGNVVMSIEVPAKGTAGVALPVPIPQGNANNNWTIQNGGSDVSNTTVDVTALFSKEV